MEKRKNDPSKKKRSTKPKQGNSNKYLGKGRFSEIWGKNKWKNLFQHVDISSAVFFRIGFGLMMLLEVYRYFSKGWIESYFMSTNFHFEYWPFHWLEPLPGDGMIYLFWGLGILSIFIILGLFYRISATLFFFGFTYMFLLEQAKYLNHFYLVALVSFVLIFIPLHRSASLDARIFKKIRAETIPAWCLWMLRFMVALPYFFGGVAKLNPDWLQGYPMRPWLKNAPNVPDFLKRYDPDALGYFLSYSGTLLDLLIVPALLIRKTRLVAYIVIALFHLTNANMFIIGIFPWLMILATTIFFDPDWARSVWNSIIGKSRKWKLNITSKQAVSAPNILSKSQKLVLFGLIFWVGLQVLYPMRRFVIPGVAHWTEEGHRYSWRMKLRNKGAFGTFKILDTQTKTLINEVNPKDYLPRYQYNNMISRPILIWQYAQLLKERYRNAGQQVEIYADIKASLNGRAPQQLIDPNVDLAAEPRPIWPPTPWIIPLNTPLPNK